MALARRVYNRLHRDWRRARMAWHLQRHGVQHGPGPLYSFQLPILDNRGQITVGKSFRISASQTRPEMGTAKHGVIVIGDHVFLNKGATLYAKTRVTIGDHCMIGDYATIWDSSFHQVTPKEEAQTAPVTLGRNVWVGRNAIVMPGVTIGDHAVIAAGAIVTKDVPPRTVVAGVPAQVVKTFDCADDFVRV